MAELHHECGLAAMCRLSTAPRDANVAPLSHVVSGMLSEMQNRGQQAAGMTVLDAGSLRTFKRLGMVCDAFAELPEMNGQAAIGHVRYATCGANELRFAQPFSRTHADQRKSFAIAFNGQLANFDELRREVAAIRTAECDTEILVHLIAHSLDATNQPDLPEVFRRLCRRLDGAYNLVFLNAAGDMIALRDPTGLRPLCWATDGERVAAASESWPLAQLAFRDIRSVAPGEMILVQDGNVRTEKIVATQRTSHCFFEWIYFANPQSILDGKSVSAVREALGKQLAAQESLPLDETTIVVPVPQTATLAAEAIASALGLPLVYGLERNTRVGRTFIDGIGRENRVRQKFTPRADLLAARRVILVEDTIIRGTTMKLLVADLRQRGQAAEVHVRVACPPMVAPCYYGIDIATVTELFAPPFMSSGRPTPGERAKMASALGADSLAYLPLEAISRAIGIPGKHLCQACTTGHYPTPAGQRLYDLALRQSNASNGDPGHGGVRATIGQKPCNR